MLEIEDTVGSKHIPYLARTEVDYLSEQSVLVSSYLEYIIRF